MKRPAAAKKKAIVVQKIKGNWVHPKPNLGTKDDPPPAMDYRGAKIHTSYGKEAYRLILRPSESPSDKPYNWKGDPAKACTECLQAVDQDRK